MIRKLLKSKPFRLVAYALLGIVVLLALAWFLRLAIADYAIRALVKDDSIESFDFRLTELEFDALTFQDIELVSNAGTLKANKFSLSYDYQELWDRQQIESLRIEGASILLGANEGDTAETPTSTEFPKSKSELLALIDPSSFSPLPVHRIQIVDSRLLIPSEQIELPFSAELASEEEFTYAFSVDTEITGIQLKADGVLSHPEKTRIQISLTSDDALTSLTQLWPEWTTALPDGMNVTVEESSLDLLIAAKTPVAIDLKLASPQFDYQETHASFDFLNLQLAFETLDHIDWDAQIKNRDTHYDQTLRFNTENISLAGEMRDFDKIILSTTTAIDWNYDQDFVQGTSSLEIEYSLSGSQFPFQGSIDVSNFSVSDIRLQPFAIDFQSDLETYRIKIPDLFLESASEAITLASDASLTLPDDESLPISIFWRSNLNPNAWPETNKALSTDTLAFDLAVEVAETGMNLKVDLQSSNQGLLVEIPETLSLRGGFKLSGQILEDETTQTYNATFTTHLNGGELLTSELRATGIEASKSMQFENLPISFSEQEFASTESLLAAILPFVTSKLNWQANEISNGELTAQWSGGTIDFYPEGTAYKVNIETMAGAIAFDAYRFEQLYLTTQLDGDLQEAGGQTTANTLFEGIPLQIDLKHEFLDAFDEPSLSGEYVLQPVSIAQSDLIGRVASSVAGSTFSATLSANGKYRFFNNDFQSSVKAAISDAAFDYTPSKISAEGMTLALELENAWPLASGNNDATFSVSSITAGDLVAHGLSSTFRFKDGESLALSELQVSLLGGQAQLHPIEIPLDGGDFAGVVSMENIDLAELSNYVDLFRGRMTGKISGDLPFAYNEGAFIAERGSLKLPDGEKATLSYPAEGLLTGETEGMPAPKPTFSDRLLKFLKIEPEAMAEEALSQVTIDSFHAEFFPEDAPMTPLRIRLSGTAHSSRANIPVVIQTNVHGTFSELYNFLIRLNSI